MSETRKHLYLITEHEDEDRVGAVAVYDSAFSRGTKNEEIPITVRDEEKQGFDEIGKKVHLGYLTYKSDESYQKTPADSLARSFQAKIRDVDRKWAEKAGVVEAAYDE